MSTTRKAASAVSSGEGHGLAFGGQPLGSAQSQRDAIAIGDGWPDLGFTSDPQQLLRGQHRSVTGFGEAGFGE
jgi:hypothetical protein